jgi:hypothetical protein
VVAQSVTSRVVLSSMVLVGVPLLFLCNSWCRVSSLFGLHPYIFFLRSFVVSALTWFVLQNLFQYFYVRHSIQMLYMILYVPKCITVYQLCSGLAVNSLILNTVQSSAIFTCS